MKEFETIISILKEKNPQAIEDVTKAYKIAEEAHRGIFRESGEPYISHPLHVALNLLKMEVYDKDTICASLLHDVVEDTNITLKDIEESINPIVAELVDGVTKMRRMNFSTKEEQNLANTRKIITGLTKDVRIILIKLADRLHNMQTLEFKRPEKQRENAIETMELFVPLALSIGAYSIKSELEDLSLKYIEPDAYKRIVEKRSQLNENERAYLEEIKFKLAEILKCKNIPNEIILRMKNVTTIYRKILKGYEMENMYDLFYLKILVEEVEDCYRTLYYVHRNIPPINGRFKDYIFNPRTNLYRSLHTTVADQSGRLLKTKIRTFDMDKVSAYGISAYWNLPKDKGVSEIPLYMPHEQTQKLIRERIQFARRLQEIDESFTENRDFIKEIKGELLTEHVYVYANGGEIIELPYGSTALDFVCQVSPDTLDKLTGIIVNGKERSFNYVLRNNDRVEVKTDGLIDRENWENSVNTLVGKQKIHRLTNRQTQ